jgi:hypothetical protein
MLDRSLLHFTAEPSVVSPPPLSPPRSLPLRRAPNPTKPPKGCVPTPCCFWCPASPPGGLELVVFTLSPTVNEHCRLLTSSSIHCHQWVARPLLPPKADPLCCTTACPLLLPIRGLEELHLTPSSAIVTALSTTGRSKPPLPLLLWHRAAEGLGEAYHVIKPTSSPPPSPDSAATPSPPVRIAASHRPVHPVCFNSLHLAQ